MWTPVWISSAEAWVSMETRSPSSGGSASHTRGPAGVSTGGSPPTIISSSSAPTL